MNEILLHFSLKFLPTLAVYYHHPNIHQHSWNILELSPTTMLDILLSMFYAGIGGMKLVFNSRQQNPPHLVLYSSLSKGWDDNVE